MTRRPWEAERVVDIALARRLIRARFPDVAADRIEPLGEGWDNTVYRVDREWVFRFPRRSIGADILEQECAVLARLSGKLPVAVPAPRLAQEEGGEFPWPFAGYPFLPGRPACRAELEDGARCRLATPLGRFIAALHESGAGRLGGLDIGGDTIGRMDLSRRLPALRARLDALADAGVIRSVRPWEPLLEAPPVSTSRPVRLVHGDLYSCHLLIDHGPDLTGIIDWGDVHLGDPACDLAIAFSFFPSGAREEFLEAAGGADAGTLRLARSRALHHTAAILAWAHDRGDRLLLEEGLRAMENIRSGADT